MGERALRTLVEGGAFFEGPRWHAGRWWVSDFYRYGVFAVTPDGASEQVLEVEGQPSGLGWMPDGSLLVVSMRDHRLLRRAPDGEVSVHADLTEHCGGHLNDLLVDATGRAYTGNFGFDIMNFAAPGRHRASCASSPTAPRSPRARTCGSRTGWRSTATS